MAVCVFLFALGGGCCRCPPPPEPQQFKPIPHLGPAQPCWDPCVNRWSPTNGSRFRQLYVLWVASSELDQRVVKGKISFGGMIIQVLLLFTMDWLIPFANQTLKAESQWHVKTIWKIQFYPISASIPEGAMETVWESQRSRRRIISFLLWMVKVTTSPYGTVWHVSLGSASKWTWRSREITSKGESAKQWKRRS